MQYQRFELLEIIHNLYYAEKTLHSLWGKGGNLEGTIGNLEETSRPTLETWHEQFKYFRALPANFQQPNTHGNTSMTYNFQFDKNVNMQMPCHRTHNNAKSEIHTLFFLFFNYKSLGVLPTPVLM